MNNKLIALTLIILMTITPAWAVPAAPSPACKVRIVVNDARFVPAAPCEIGDGREVSARYLIQAKIMQSLDPTTQADSSCKVLEGIHQEITTSENLIKDKQYIGTLQFSGDECNNGRYFTNYNEAAPFNPSETGCEAPDVESRYNDERYPGTNEIFIKARDMCHIVEAINKLDLTPCEQIEYNKFQAQVHCYKKVALNKKDPSICGKMIGDNNEGIPLKELCYRDYAGIMNDHAGCLSIQDTTIRDECIFNIAIRTNNAPLCDTMNDKTKVDLCKEKLGIPSGECATEGKQYSKVFKDQYLSHCCPGLTEWNSGFDTRKVENGQCIETGMVAGSPVGTCIKCGDGMCGPNENICNCPRDCIQPPIPASPPLPPPPMQPQCLQRCEQFRYSYCPPVCQRICVPINCSQGQCTADCDGPGSCTCMPQNIVPQTPPIPVPQPAPMPAQPVPTQPIPAQPPIASIECQGCKNQERCIPYGTRIKDASSGLPVYCSIDETMQIQKSNNEECQNHYECQSNTCTDSKCSSIEERIGGLERQVTEQRGLLETIIGFFKKWFG